ncbi:fasciclin domain-containing protein [Tenacibaculum singaporense]|uniref:Fasciclin domain-containing protein n=1 Tax=Tenacibaculum singaporense TaxID=2358479 RepID=A0A3Q8RS57_9FLAO|nr:fasciclin domain-containing protein [Tenacibaculum singaporense]AZJ34271.1 fasciclin domain-containing protein [Tenacibaculum singaporense]
MKAFKIIYLVALFLFFSCKKENSNSNSVNTTSIEKKEVVKPQGQASFEDEVSDPNALQKAKSIVDFSTLVTAIEAAGVQDAIVNAGPLTIFAPLNTAFEKLPANTVEDLLKPANKSKLAFVLKNHVAPANFPLEQLKKEAKKGRKLYMASGNYMQVENKEGKIYVDGVEVIQTVKVSNGWIHVIDQVLVP